MLQTELFGSSYAKRSQMSWAVVMWPRPSFFWYDTYVLDFRMKKKVDLFFFFFEKSVSYQKKGGHDHARPGFFRYDNNSGH